MKRPKKVKLINVPYQAYYSEWTCPHCGTNFTHHGFDSYVTRFKCSHCGNELIVEETT